MIRKISHIVSLLLLVTITQNILAINISENNIRINNDKKILIAPKSVHYEWYLNNSKINNTKQELKITEAGEYMVKITDSQGTSSIKKINVVLDDNGKIYTIYTIGDSTVQDYEETAYPRTGWGQIFDYFFDDQVNAINKGAGGTSALSFYTGQWSPIRDALQPGDYVFIQFGINDASSDADRHTDPFTTFQEYLTKFVEETQAKGAYPILVATLRRNAWIDNNNVYDSYHDYPVATRQLAATLNVPLVDLDNMAKTLMESLGPDYIGPYWYMNLEAGEYPLYGAGASDDVHFQEMGAIEIAKLVVETIESYDADTALNKLIPHIKKRYPVQVTTNFPDGGIFTRNNEFPAGLTITVKGIIEDGYALNSWQDSTGNVLTNNELYSFVMDTFPIKLHADLTDNPQNFDCAGKNNGTAYIDSCGECVGGNTGILPCYTEFSDSTYQIKPAHSLLCVQDVSTVKQQACRDISSQLWTFVKSGSSYKIKNKETGNFINVASTNSLTDLTTNSTGTEWRIECIGDSVYSFFPAGNITMAANVVAGRTTAGQRLLLWGRTSLDDQKYYIKTKGLKDCNGDEFGTASLDVCAICSGGNTGIEPVTDENECNVEAVDNESIKNNPLSPNPFMSETTLKLTVLPIDDTSVYVYSLQGRKVYENLKVNDNQINLGSEWEKGIYFVHVQNKDKTKIIKVIKF